MQNERHWGGWKLLKAAVDPKRRKPRSNAHSHFFRQINFQMGAGLHNFLAVEWNETFWAKIVRVQVLDDGYNARLVQDVVDADPQRRDELRRTTAALIARLRGSAEGQEGLAAFLEKRPAAWITPDKTD